MEFVTEHDMMDKSKLVKVINDRKIEGGGFGQYKKVEAEAPTPHKAYGLDSLAGYKTLKIFRKDKLVELPKYEKEGDSGLDLRSAEDVVLKPRSRALVSTGLIIELPPGHEGQVRPRSGLAAKYGITVLNTPGTIDSNFRGEVKVILLNTSIESFEVAKGMRIAQLVVAPVTRVDVTEVDEESLSQTERGAGGFGSTGHR